jgi:sarcosine oxidase subunit gamma
VLDLALTPRSPFAALAREAKPVGPSPAGVELREATPPEVLALSAGTGGERALADTVRTLLAADLPAPLTATFAGSTTLLWTQPGQWLALGEAGLTKRFARAPAQAARVIDVTGGRAVVAVSGPNAVAALQKLLPLDLDARAFAVGAAASTMAAYLTVQVWRTGPDAFALAVGRSFADSLWRALLHAGEEYGVAQHFAGRG